VNRVFRDKPGGLIVDYLGLAESLKYALANYTESGGRGEATVDMEIAATVLMEKYEIVRDMFHGFDYMSIISGALTQKIGGTAQAMEHILSQDDGKRTYLDAVTKLSKSFALAVPHPKAIEIREEVGFFQGVRSAIVKSTGNEHGRTQEDMEAAIKQLVSRAISSTDVIDIFDAAGLQKPDISILSEEFL